MPTLAVFTVKQFSCVDGRYWTYGGFGDFLAALVPHFDRILLACHPSRVAEPPAGWYPVDHANVEYHWLPVYNREDECLRRLPRMFLQSKAIVAQADIVNARMPDYTGVCGAYWARRLGRPLFVNLVDDWHAYGERLPTRLRGPLREALRAHFRLYCALERRMCRDALVFAQGDSILAQYRGHPDLHPLVSSSHGNVNVLAGRDVSAPAGSLHVVSIGRLVSVKGHEFLLRALARLRELDPARGYRATIAGDGPRLADHRRLAGELGLGDAVRFAGQLGREEVFGLLDSADLMCHPSLGEGTPKVLLEAMARGVPVVATDVGGVSTVVRDGLTGLLVAPGDAEALAQAMLRVASDARLRQGVVDRGLAEARLHTAEKEWGAMLATVKARFPQLDWRAGGADAC
jgi:glycosyltransferase involved in cell wall biosynthesis